MEPLVSYPGRKGLGPGPDYRASCQLAARKGRSSSSTDLFGMVTGRTKQIIRGAPLKGLTYDAARNLEQIRLGECFQKRRIELALSQNIC